MAYGPNPRLTRDVIAKAADYVSRGLPLHRVAFMLGFSSHIAMEWHREGSHRVRNEIPSETEFDQLRCDYYLAIEEARSRYAEKLLGRVDDATERDWRAATWLLSKSDPKDFGDKTKVEHTGVVGTVNVQSTTLTEEQAEAIKAKVFGYPVKGVPDAEE